MLYCCEVKFMTSMSSPFRNLALSGRVGGYRSVVNILAKRGVRPSHKVHPIFPVDTNFRTLPESSPSLSSVVLCFVIICSQNGSFFSLKNILDISSNHQGMICDTGWFFLTGPPLKISLDWPPQKMLRLAPP